MKNKSLNKNQIVKLIDIILASIIVVIFAVFILLNANNEADYSFDSGSIYDWGEGWTVSYSGETEDNVTIPIELEVERGKSVILKKSLPNKIKKYNCLLFESNRQDVLVHVDGVLRASYSDKDTRRYGSSSPSAIILIPVYSTDEGAAITILVTSNSKNNGNIGSIYLGNEKSIIIDMVKQNVLWLALGVAMAIMGVVCLICYFLYRNNIREGNAFIYLFCFSTLSVIYTLMGIRVRQVFVGDIRLLDSLGYLSYMLIPIFVIAYINWVSDNKHLKVCTILTAILVANFIVQSIIQLIGIYDFSEMMIVTRILFGVIMSFVLHCAGRDVVIDKRENRSENGVYILVGLLILYVDFWADVFGNLFGFTSITNKIHIIGTLAYIILNVCCLYISIIREETKRKNAENANVAKSQFLATMSHEIRTPINAVLGMNEMISRESSEKNILEYSNNIADAGKSLLSLVNDILDFSKIESGKMDIVDVSYPLKSLLNDLILMIKGRMENKGLKLILNIDENIPSVYYGDEVRIKQILTNILTNSAKYTPEGSITFTVENRGITDDEISLYFSIKDTGIGIKPEDIEKLMNSAFVRVDAARNRNIEGTGLGLSITRQLLTLMGSELELDSVYGKGSDFHFILKQKIIDKTPMGSISVKSERAAKKKAVSFTIPDVRILAVDDTKTNLLVIKGLLKPYKCQVFTCASGEECISLCKNGTYDIILMDHMMPGMDGIETLRILKDEELLPIYTKVIALTANAISGAAEMYVESGFDGYVTKPIDVKELDSCLRNNLDPKLI